MSKKIFSVFIFLLFISGTFLSPDRAQSSYCSDSREKCNTKCCEITLDDILQRECYEACQEAYGQCIKERPYCAAEDACCSLRREVEKLRSKVHHLEGKLHSQERDQK